MSIDAGVDAIYRMLFNKQVTDPATGIMTVYDANGVTPVYVGNVYEDAQAAILYRGNGADRRERLK